ncbi:MAG: hypothetical protein KA998_01715, partial [Rickettsiaceae bacterium]|nr:hypothetical protein [Rickettsiaceae bacterium]
MKKIIIPTVFIVLSFLLYLAFIWTIDYSKIEEDIKILSNNKAMSDRFEGVEISKLPIPRVLLKGVTLPGGIKADSVSVSLNGKSIVNRVPKISFINILFAGNSVQIPVNYLDGKT